MPFEEYLKSGVYIGTNQKTKFIEEFIYAEKSSKGKYIFDISKIDERIRLVAKFLSNYEPSEILVVAKRMSARKPAKLFAKYTKADEMVGKYVAGTLTNPSIKYYREPEVLLAADPFMDSLAIKEAVTMGIPVVSFVNTYNSICNIDLMVPANNRGRKALALVFYLLAREYLRNRGVLKEDQELSEKGWEEFVPSPKETSVPPWIRKQLELKRRRRRSRK